jgi:hypothetical protein
MPVETKTYNFTKIEFPEQVGLFKAVFSTLNVKDKDGDVTVNGALGEQKILISQYNHGSWEKGADALPIGVGRIYELNNEAVVEGEFDMEDADAVKTYKKLKYLSSKNRVQEWSYSLPEITSEIKTENGERVRYLLKIRTNEVSPVLMGAGTNTRLLDIKSDKQSIPIAEHFETVQVAVEQLVKRIKDLGELRAKDGRHPSEETMKRTGTIKCVLGELIRELEEVQADHDEGYKAHMEFLKMNGGNN